MGSGAEQPDDTAPLVLALARRHRSTLTFIGAGASAAFAQGASPRVTSVHELSSGRQHQYCHDAADGGQYCAPLKGMRAVPSSAVGSRRFVIRDHSVSISDVTADRTSDTPVAPWRAVSGARVESRNVESGRASSGSGFVLVCCAGIAEMFCCFSLILRIAVSQL